jgi:hypothetical protein
MPFRARYPSFEKEGKVLIFNTIYFSSSSEEEYPDCKSGGGGGLFQQPLGYGLRNIEGKKLSLSKL